MRPGSPARPAARTETVAFTGRTGGVHAATWGQVEMWRTIERHRPSGFYQLSQVIPVCGGPAVEEVLDVVARLVGRHQSLRTTFAVDERGGLSQVIHCTGSVPVEVREVACEDGERPAADSAAAAFMAREPQLEREFAPRFAVVSRQGLGKYVVVVCSHVVLDGYSERLLAEQVTAMLRSGPPPLGADPGEPGRRLPSEQARIEALAKSRRTSQRSVGYWRSTLAEAPSGLFEGAPAERGGEVWCGRLVSERMDAAVRTLGRTSGLGSAPLYLSATALVLGTGAGKDAVNFRVPVGNRFDSALDGYIGNLSQHTVLNIDTATGTFYGMVHRIGERLLKACLHARYDPDELAEAIADVESRRGAPLDLAYLFNDLRSRAGNRNRSRNEQPARSRGTSGSELAWYLLHTANSDTKVHVRITDTGGPAALEIAADTAYLPRAAIADRLRGVERLLTRAAHGDFAL